MKGGKGEGDPQDELSRNKNPNWMAAAAEAPASRPEAYRGSLTNDICISAQKGKRGSRIP